MKLVKNKKALQGVCTGVLCFFSLFSCAAAALAWFCNNKMVKNNGLEVGSEHDDLHATYSIYKYNKDNKGSDEDDSVEVEEGASLPKLTIRDFTLNTYDTIFVAQNAYTPALIRIHLYGGDLPDASSSNPQNVTVKIHRNTSFVERDESITDPFLYKCISNVANFTLAIPTSTSYMSYVSGNDLDTFNNVEQFFDDAVASFKSGSDEGITFFETTGEGDDAVTIKNDTLQLSTTYTETKKINDVNHIMLYLYVDYNLDLLENFTETAEQSLGADFLSQVDTELLNDLSSIEVKLQ